MNKAIAVAITSVALVATATVRADMVSYHGHVHAEAESPQLKVIHNHDWSRLADGVESAMNLPSTLTVVDKASGRQRLRIKSPPLNHIWVSPDSRFIVGLSHIKLWNPIQLIVWDAWGHRIFAEQMKQVAICFKRAEFQRLVASDPEDLGWWLRCAEADGDRVRVPFGVYGHVAETLRPYMSETNWCSSLYAHQVYESVTNVVDWYDMKNPDVGLVRENDLAVAVTLRDLDGQPMTIPLVRRSFFAVPDDPKIRALDCGVQR